MYTALLLLLLACGAAVVSAAHLPSVPSRNPLDNNSFSLVQQRVPRETITKKGKMRAKANFKNQILRLERLKCKPKWTKVTVKQYMRGHDVLDKEPFPEVVAVRRCIKECSYCGDKFGKENQVCEPDIVRNKTIILKYIASEEGMKYYKVKIPEHRRCKCKDPQELHVK